jgi:hypothetical protein
VIAPDGVVPEEEVALEGEKKNNMQHSNRTRRWIYVLLACVAVSLVLVAYPV